jgi:hypothetical protein
LPAIPLLNKWGGAVVAVASWGDLGRPSPASTPSKERKQMSQECVVPRPGNWIRLFFRALVAGPGDRVVKRVAQKRRRWLASVFGALAISVAVAALVAAVALSITAHSLVPLKLFVMVGLSIFGVAFGISLLRNGPLAWAIDEMLSALTGHTVVRTDSGEMGIFKTVKMSDGKRWAVWPFYDPSTEKNLYFAKSPPGRRRGWVCATYEEFCEYRRARGLEQVGPDEIVPESLLGPPPLRHRWFQIDVSGAMFGNSQRHLFGK